MPADSVIKLATICFCYLSIRDKPHNGGGVSGGGIGPLTIKPIIDKWSVSSKTKLIILTGFFFKKDGIGPFSRCRCFHVRRLLLLFYSTLWKICSGISNGAADFFPAFNTQQSPLSPAINIIYHPRTCPPPPHDTLLRVIHCYPMRSAAPRSEGACFLGFFFLWDPAPSSKPEDSHCNWILDRWAI